MKERIKLAIAQFSDIYNEWDDYRIRIVDDSHVSVYNKENLEHPYPIEDASEILTDFRAVLKKNNLMISSAQGDSAEISPYTYSFESEYEVLADQIENSLGNKITNIFVFKGEDGDPEVEYELSTNMTSGEAQQIKKKIDVIINQYIAEHKTENEEEEFE